MQCEKVTNLLQVCNKFETANVAKNKRKNNRKMKFFNSKKFLAAFCLNAMAMFASLILSNMPDLAGFIFLALFGLFGFVVCVMMGILTFELVKDICKEEKGAKRDDDGYEIPF